jgi:hypothetical protein
MEKVPSKTTRRPSGIQKRLTKGIARPSISLGIFFSRVLLPSKAIQRRAGGTSIARPLIKGMLKHSKAISALIISEKV